MTLKTLGGLAPPKPVPATGCSMPRQFRTITAAALAWVLSAGVASPHVQTSIHRMAGGNDVSLLRALVSRGADPSAIGPRGQTPLHFAASRSENPEVILALVAAGAYVDAADDDGFSPLHVAIKENRSLDIVATLIAAGASVNRSVSRGEYFHGERAGGSRWTSWLPIHLAAKFSKDPAIVSLLIGMGADINTPMFFDPSFGGRNMTPLDMALDSGSDAIVRVLQDAGATPYQQPRVADTDEESGGFNWGKAAAIAGVAALGVKAADAGVPVEDVVELTGAAIADIAGETGGENMDRVARSQAADTDVSPGLSRLASATLSGDCEIPGFAEETSPPDFDAVGLSWCPADVGLQVRSQALNVELNRCMFTLGRVTMATTASHRANIQDSCKILEAMAPDRCQCPSSYYELGRN